MYEAEDYEQDGRRNRLSQEDSEFLIKAFAENPRPSQQERTDLANAIGLNSRSIQIWFQNRRAKLKRESNDPGLFSVRRKNKDNSESKDCQVGMDYGHVTLATARNFKELCQPGYLDIPIKGHHLTAEDLFKNEAIKKFWRNHQMLFNEAESTDERSNSCSISSTPSKEKRQSIDTEVMANEKKKFKSSLEMIDGTTTLNMPELIPFQKISSSNFNSFDPTNLSFLTSTEKLSSSPKYYVPQLDTFATNLDFLFNPDVCSTNLDAKDHLFSNLFFHDFENQINN